MPVNVLTEGLGLVEVSAAVEVVKQDIAREWEVLDSHKLVDIFYLGLLGGGKCSGAGYGRQGHNE